MKGACASLARRRAISVLPTPVGPIIRMFFGSTSSRMAASSSPTVAERHRDSALGVLLADNEAIELRDDLAGTEIGHAQAFSEAAEGVGRLSRVMLVLV